MRYSKVLVSRLNKWSAFAQRQALKGQCHEIFASDFFHESVSPQPQSIPLGQVLIFFFFFFLNIFWGDFFLFFLTIFSTASSAAPGTVLIFFRKFAEILASQGAPGILRGMGETDSWKQNQKSKISWHCPFNPDALVQQYRRLQGGRRWNDPRRYPARARPCQVFPHPYLHLRSALKGLYHNNSQK